MSGHEELKGKLLCCFESSAAAVTSAQCGIHTQITRRLIGPSLNCTQNERVDGWDFFLGILEHHVVEVDDRY